MIVSAGKPVSIGCIKMNLPPKRYSLTSRQINKKRNFLRYRYVVKKGWIGDINVPLDNTQFFWADGEDKYAWCLHYRFPRFVYYQSRTTGRYKVGYVFGGKYELWHRQSIYNSRSFILSGKFYNTRQFKKFMFIFKQLLKTPNF